LSVHVLLAAVSFNPEAKCLLVDRFWIPFHWTF
jgi:hypothetical protein